MLKIIIGFLTSKGTLIGFFSSLLKILQDVRNKNLNWVIAVTDLVAGTVVGYSIYVWASESENLQEWQRVILTIIISLNSFLVIKIMTNPKIIKSLISNWFKIDVKE